MNIALRKSLKIVRKSSILCIVFLSMLMPIVSSASDTEDRAMMSTLVMKSKGRYLFGDIKSNDIYMLDTHTGRLWKNTGTAKKPGSFITSQYLNKDSQLIYQPEIVTAAEIYDGRFTFKEIQSDNFYIFDRELGAVWKLDGSAGNPTKLIPVVVEN